MSESFPVDIEEERVQVDGQWLSFDEVTDQIRQRVERGDFHVAQLSMALESLEHTLSTVETIELKLSPKLLAAYRELSAAQGQSLDATCRKALRLYLQTLRSGAPQGAIRSLGH
jgi:hypothetical protein